LGARVSSSAAMPLRQRPRSRCRRLTGLYRKEEWLRSVDWLAEDTDGWASLPRQARTAEIKATVSKSRLNRGLGVKGEVARHCDRDAEVLRRVHRCIDEGTARLLQRKNTSIMPEYVACEGTYIANCRSLYSFSSIYGLRREIWLDRVEAPGAST
jgi:hypothetical protein